MIIIWIHIDSKSSKIHSWIGYREWGKEEEKDHSIVWGRETKRMGLPFIMMRSPGGAGVGKGEYA